MTVKHLSWRAAFFAFIAVGGLVRESEMGKCQSNPMQSEPHGLAQAPRCRARTRSGEMCRSPAVNGNPRCRMHGGKGSCAPSGNRNAWKHGARSADTLAAVQYVKAIARLVRRRMSDQSPAARRCMYYCSLHVD
jgi:glucans biosynthesis protein